MNTYNDNNKGGKGKGYKQDKIKDKDNEDVGDRKGDEVNKNNNNTIAEAIANIFIHDESITSS